MPGKATNPIALPTKPSVASLPTISSAYSSTNPIYMATTSNSPVLPNPILAHVELSPSSPLLGIPKQGVSDWVYNDDRLRVSFLVPRSKTQRTDVAAAVAAAEELANLKTGCFHFQAWEELQRGMCRFITPLHEVSYLIFRDYRNSAGPIDKIPVWLSADYALSTETNLVFHAAVQLCAVKSESPLIS